MPVACSGLVKPSISLELSLLGVSLISCLGCASACCPLATASTLIFAGEFPLMSGVLSSPGPERITELMPATPAAYQ